MRTKKRLLFALLVVALFLAASELAVRLSFPGLTAKVPTMQFTNPHLDQPESFERDPALFWRLRPDNAAWEVNGDGYRGPLRPRAKPPGTLRVCCLGDSCTFGLGTPPVAYAPFAVRLPAPLSAPHVR